MTRAADMAGLMNASGELAPTAIRFPDNSSQSTVPAPSYAVSQKLTYGMNAWNQVTTNGTVVVVASGPYMNGLQIYAGVNTSGNYTRIGYMGDDINVNTKAQSFSFPIKSGYWFYVASDGFPGGFEYVDIFFWPNV